MEETKMEDAEMENEEPSQKQLQAFNTFKNLMKTKLPYGQQYCIWAYFLLDKPSDEGLYGKLIFLGAYQTKKDALEKATEIFKNTKHEGIIISIGGKWEDLTTKPDMCKIKWVAEDHEAELHLQQEREMKKENKKREKAERIKKEIEIEMRNEDNPSTLDHYTQNWFLAVKDKAAIKMYRQKLEEMEKAYNKRVNLIQKQESLQPEMETIWLSSLETKMKDRDEAHIFASISTAARELGPEILPHRYPSS